MGEGRWGDVGQMRETIFDIFQDVNTLDHPRADGHVASTWNVQGQSSREKSG